MRISTRLLIVSLLFPTLKAVSQISITSAYNPSIGDIYVYKIADTTANPGQNGSGVIWNLGTLPSTLNTQQYNWKAPSATGLGGNFPASTLAAEVVNVSTGTTYEYYDASGADLKVVGKATASAQDNFGSGYRIFAYPLTYTQSCVDSILGTNGVANIYGTATTTYDGYGTLQLPAQSGGNFPNVARVKIVEDYVINYGFGSDIFVYTETFLWYDNTTANGKKQPILLITTTDMSGLATSHTKFVGVRQILFQNIVSDKLSSSNVKIYPNPFRDKIMLSLPALNSEVFVQVSDMTGRIVEELRLEKSSSAIKEESIMLDQLHSGVYLVKISSSKGTVVQRITKE